MVDLWKTDELATSYGMAGFGIKCNNQITNDPNISVYQCAIIMIIATKTQWAYSTMN